MAVDFDEQDFEKDFERTIKSFEKLFGKMSKDVKCLYKEFHKIVYQMNKE